MEAASRQNASGDAAAIGRRIRAALILGGKSAADIAPELNISTRTLDRTIGGERLPREWELRRLAELLPVPAWFLLDGFEGTSASETTPELAELRALGEAIETEVIPRLDLLLTPPDRVPYGDADPAAEVRAAAAAAAEAAEQVDRLGPEERARRAQES